VSLLSMTGKFVDICGYRFGGEKSTVKINGKPYLQRWIIYAGGTLRLHKFYRGDDDRAMHDHPWWFVTFPLKGYWEQVPNPKSPTGLMKRFVKPFRFHYRPAKFKHIVLGSTARYDVDVEDIHVTTPKPFWTLVISGPRSNKWGFWPDGKYVYYRDFK
jgi:hypothetical protein